MNKLPFNIPPLNSVWEYEAALKVLNALKLEAVSKNYKGDNSKELKELQIRVDDYINTNFQLPTE